MSDLIEMLAAVDHETVTDDVANAIFSLAERLAKYKLEAKLQLVSPEVAAKWLTHQLKSLDYETFGVIYLNSQHRVIAIDDSLMTGTIDGAMIYPRRIVKACLEKGAAAIAVFHNHPSGVCIPSDADKRITTRISAALELIDVRLLDHYILGAGEFYSFSEQGIL